MPSRECRSRNWASSARRESIRVAVAPVQVREVRRQDALGQAGEHRHPVVLPLGQVQPAQLQHRLEALDELRGPGLQGLGQEGLQRRGRPAPRAAARRRAGCACAGRRPGCGAARGTRRRQREDAGGLSLMRRAAGARRAPRARPGFRLRRLCATASCAAASAPASRPPPARRPGAGCARPSGPRSAARPGCARLLARRPGERRWRSSSPSAMWSSASFSICRRLIFICAAPILGRWRPVVNAAPGSQRRLADPHELPGLGVRSLGAGPGG